MAFWTTPSGEKLTAKQFGQRWKEGISKVTPLQQAKSTLFGNFIVIFGIIFGIISTIITRTWWLVTILSGSLIITLISTLGTIQKIYILSNIYNIDQTEVTNEKSDEEKK